VTTPDAIDLDPHRLHGEEPPLWLFEIEIGRQARIALRAAAELDRAANRPETDFDGIFGAIQALLAAAANISKVLWPVSTRATRDVIPRRGAILRARLTVGDDSALRDRRLRNHFEHFDERLESFIAQQTRSFADVLVGAAPGSRPDYLEQFYFRRYDPERNEAALAATRSSWAH
jgi:hypothetical protein